MKKIIILYLLLVHATSVCMDNQSPTGLIPRDLWLPITSHISFVDKNSIRQTCKDLHKSISINNPDTYLFNTDTLPQTYKQYGLLLSLYHNKINIAQHLLKHGADYDAKYFLPCSAKELTSYLYPSITAIELNSFSEKPNSLLGFSSFILDCFFGNTEKLKNDLSLSEKITNLPFSISSLHFAMIFRHYSTVQLLLSHNAIKQLDQEYRVYNNNSPEIALKPLHYAVKYNCTELAQLLIAHKASCDALDIFNQTPLEIAVNLLNIPLIELLCKHSNQKTLNRALYKVACLKKHTIIPLLYSKGADCNYQVAVSTPLHGALDISNDNTSKDLYTAIQTTVEALLNVQNQEINVNFMDHSALTPLNKALTLPENEETKDIKNNIIQLLKDKGAKTDKELCQSRFIFCFYK